MSKKLADGWYRLPGDGLAGDPDKFYNAHYFPTVGASRLYHWAKILDGQVVSLSAWIDDTARATPLCPLDDPSYHTTGYLGIFEKAYACKVIDVLVDEYKPQVGLDLAKTALAAGGVVTVIGVLKNLFGKRAAKSAKKQLELVSEKQLATQEQK